MDYPKYDPHGDPIPDADGMVKPYDFKPVSTFIPGEGGTICGVRNHSTSFLQYLEKQSLTISQCHKTIERVERHRQRTQPACAYQRDRATGRE